MNRLATWLALFYLIPALPTPADPLRVLVTVAPRPYFVGQGIEVRVESEAGPGMIALAVETPRVGGAEVFASPADPDRPSLSRFVVVPGRAGLCDLPAIRVRSGERSGVSKPLKWTVAGVPTEGRTASFLGGVGPFEVHAEVEPASVRVGEALEYRISIAGPAAWGSSRPPDLTGWASASLQVERSAEGFEPGERPVRTFRYRLRPLKAGPLILPPVAVSAFDPATRRYSTRTTTSRTVQVEEPPRFDPALLGDPPVTTSARSSPWKTIGVVGGVGISIVALILARSRRKARPIDPRALAMELANGLGRDPRANEAEAAREVAEALTGFLQRVGNRPPGVLTPMEARADFDRLTGDPALGGDAAALLVRCDRAQYRSSGGSNEASEIIAAGRRFFEAIAAGRDWGGPGEAVETVVRA